MHVLEKTSLSSRGSYWKFHIKAFCVKAQQFGSGGSGFYYLVSLRASTMGCRSPDQGILQSFTSICLSRSVAATSIPPGLCLLFALISCFRVPSRLKTSLTKRHKALSVCNVLILLGKRYKERARVLTNTSSVWLSASSAIILSFLQNLPDFSTRH